MKSPLLMLCCLLHVAFAQVSDNFADGNFSINPTWIGDDSLFQVNTSLQLQSKGSSAKDISLATAVVVETEMEWQCWMRFNLSPSTSNFCRYCLLSDVPNCKGNVNGYYVQLGGVTGNTDSITLYKQKGNSRTRIIAGRASTVSKNNNTVRLKILRNTLGNWQLFSDTTGGHNFILEGTGKDTEFWNVGFTGIFVRYTASNAQNYFVDDVYAGPKIVDVTPPRVDSVVVISATQLKIVFSEAVEQNSALTAKHYTINNGIGIPVSVDIETGKNNSTIIELNDALSNQTYELIVSGIADLNGNTLNNQRFPFSYNMFVPQENDIVISEFFPDPTPAIGLPEKEFVELYNRSNKIINLNGWTISDGSTTAVLGNYVLAPDSFVMVCSAANVPDFAPFGAVARVISLPSLNNAADQIILKDPTGKIIHQVNYDLSWYVDLSKRDGGYSIEMNNPNQLCLGKLNFAASDDGSGGTPGRQNSRWNIYPDTSLPDVLGVFTLDAQAIAIVFTEQMDSFSLVNASVLLPGYTILNKTIHPTKDTLVIRFSSMFAANQMLSVSVSMARDCSGNRMNVVTKTFQYFVPQPAHQFDVLINEWLADPDPPVILPNAEFIELHNTSNKFISLKGWTLSDANSTAKLPAYILQPDSFLVITTVANAGKFTLPNCIGVSGFPSLGNDGDALTLADDFGRVIHYVEFTSNAYKDNVKKNGGWSLELVDAQNPCGGDYNLMASIHPHGGTPGYVNSSRKINRDKVAPLLIKTYPISNNRLQLIFSEQMDSTSLLNIKYYASNSLASPSQIRLFGPDYRKVELMYTDSFISNYVYRILVDSFVDCARNRIVNNIGDFGLPVLPDSGDIAINEILFDPKVGGTDYVEIINRTDKFLDLKNVWIANADDQNQIKEYYAIDSTGWLLFPNTYAVITDDANALKMQYFTPNTKQLIQTKMPTYSNDEGRCVLLNKDGKRFDQFDYTDRMHYPLLDNKDGVSLERIDFNRPTDDASNWTSASSTSGYGTPTYQNSQYAKAFNTNNIISIHPAVFSPDGDGYNDHLTFSYSLPSSAYTANLYIFNAAGVLVKQLLLNEILGTSGVFGWDGITDKGEKAAMGIYLYYFEAFNLKGDVIKAKSTLVVGAKLD